MKNDEQKKDEKGSLQSSGVSVELSSEIDSAIEQSFKEGKMPEGEKPDTEEVEVNENVDDAKAGEADLGETDNDDQPYVAGDEDMERAVKAGLPMSSVRSFADKEALLSVVALLESKQDKAAGGDESKSGGDDPDEDDIEVPDLSEDDGYDPGLVKAFAALKAQAKKQSETIKSLKAGGESLGAKNWLDSKVAELGDEFKDALGVGEKTVTDDQAETRTKVQAKFDVLTAGYKSAKIDVPKDEVFAEALKLVVGDVAGTAATAARAKALASRGRLALSRASSASGAAREKPSQESVERDIADEINEKFFK